MELWLGHARLLGWITISIKPHKGKNQQLQLYIWDPANRTQTSLWARRIPRKRGLKEAQNLGEEGTLYLQH
jgi:hypothetical protein